MNIFSIRSRARGSLVLTIWVRDRYVFHEFGFEVG